MKKISRRKFSKQIALSAAFSPIAVNAMVNPNASKKNSTAPGKLRLGGPIYKDEFSNPDEWISVIKTWDTMLP